MGREQRMPPELASSADHSGFVLAVRVDEPGATSMPELQADEHTAVVRIDRVYKSPAGSPDLTGERLTVYFTEPKQRGDRGLVFADAWAYGRGIALRETSSRWGKDARGALSGVEAVLEETADRELARRVESAELVVVGTVNKMTPAVTSRRARTRLTEHDPGWWVAELVIHEVLHGESGQSRVRVAFPTSDDVMWYRYPRPTPGLEAVWLLQRMDLPALPRGAYVLPDIRDIQPLSERRRVDSIVDRQR